MVGVGTIHARLIWDKTSQYATALLNRANFNSDNRCAMILGIKMYTSGKCAFINIVGRVVITVVIVWWSQLFVLT